MLNNCPMGVRMIRAARCAPNNNIMRTTDFYFFFLNSELSYEENNVFQEECQAKTSRKFRGRSFHFLENP